MPSRPARNKRRSNKKWSPVLKSQAVSQNVTAGGQLFQVVSLCANSSNIETAPTATIIKCGNFKIVGDVNVSQSFNASGRMFCMYIPQGYTPEDTTPTEHPEWILCWRGFEPGVSGLQTFSMQSKLKRNLNSGDKVILLIEATNYSSTTANVAVSVTASYVCCAN
nr:MAG: capsid protein [ssDNA virus sp.]WLW36776.1 capsid protein [ssDNA virus sp.]